MTTLLGLANKLEKMAGEVNKIASVRAVAVARAILTHLVYVTPVDTSRALSNWQIGIGGPVPSSIPAYFEGQKGSTKQSSASEALSVGIAELNRKQPGESIFISNLTPYIKELNEGSSRQAPAGFVENAVIVGRMSAREEGKK